MAIDAFRKPAAYPYSVRLNDEQESRMAEMRGAGASPSEVFQRGFDLAYGEWKHATSSS
jgi:hypothetical protein